MISIVIVTATLILCSCGPSWENVIQHSNGVYEDTKTGECWIYSNGQHVPVECPKKDK